MLAGELYDGMDPELIKGRAHASELMHLLNATTETSPEQRVDLIKQLFGKVGNNAYINPPFYCDYGSNIIAEDYIFINFGCVILDCNIVKMGTNVLLAPYVQIYTAYHPTDPKVRATFKELASPVTIGNQVWIGGGAIICPGVTIGDNTTIGAGSIVTKDIPANVVAVGNPCRVIRKV